MGWLEDESGLERCAANYVPLTPLSPLNRAALVFPEQEALVYGNVRHNYREYHERVTRLASGLTQLGIVPGDVIATLLPNIPAHAEAHFAVPATGAILNAINIRLDSGTVAYIFEHSGAKLVLVDTAFVDLAGDAIAKMDGPGPKIIEVVDTVAGQTKTGRFPTYESLITSGDASFDWVMPSDEWESLALNYTSGTTGRPKGVVVHHRGAYLHSMGTAVFWQTGLRPRYLAIVPMFHCNNWNHTWMMPVIAGTLICCRDITAQAMYDAIADEGITHLGAAPIVLNTIVNATASERRDFDHVVQVLTAGAPPPAATLRAIEPLGFNVMQVYGLTETYGHVTECVWQGDAWDDLPEEDRYAIKARTGVAGPMMEHITVMNPETMGEVPRDGASIGEIMIRGNSVMKGYFKNPEATAEAFAGGYFHSGDIAIQHPDSYIQITDRAKDIIISGGENVSSVEIEGTLMHHAEVLLCAVVAKPDDKWGEVPCAFVELKADGAADEAELIAFVRARLAGFKTPKRVVFCELPKTSTGKIQKFELRKAAKAL